MQQLPTTKSISSLGVLPLKLFTFKGLKVHLLPWIFSGSIRVRSPMMMLHESEEVASHKVAKKKYSEYIGVSRPARGWPKKNASEPTASALLCSESGSELLLLPPWPWGVSQIISFLHFSQRGCSFLPEGHSSLLENCFSLTQLLLLQQHWLRPTCISVQHCFPPGPTCQLQWGNTSIWTDGAGSVGRF